MEIRRAQSLPVHTWLRQLPLPIWLYRLHPSLGDHSLLLTHIGCRHRQTQQTLLQVIAHDSTDDSYIVAAGWGKRSEWFRTIQRKPRVLVHVGSQRFEAIATRLSESDVRRALRDYACRYPSAFRTLAGTMAQRQSLSMSDDFRSLAHTIQMIALRPLHSIAAEHSQPELQADGACRAAERM